MLSVKWYLNWNPPRRRLKNLVFAIEEAFYAICEMTFELKSAAEETENPSKNSQNLNFSAAGGGQKIFGFQIYVSSKRPVCPPPPWGGTKILIPPHHGGGQIRDPCFLNYPPIWGGNRPHGGGQQSSVPPHMGGDRKNFTPKVWRHASCFPPP